MNTIVFSGAANAIRYTHTAEGVHPQTKVFNSFTTTIKEVIVTENAHVAMIRQYHDKATGKTMGLMGYCFRLIVT